MTKKRVFTILIALTLVVTSLFMFSACATTYSLYSYEYYGNTYEIGDEFYGVEIKKDLVELKLKGEELELRISKAFIQGKPSLANEYETYTGTYTETDSEIHAIIPGLSSGTISITKVGSMFSLRLSSKSTVILKK